MVGIWNRARRCVESYEQAVLAIGAASSFANFCLVARAIWTILVSGLGVSTGQYVDDYPVIPLAALANQLQDIIDRLFSVLGWDTKQAGQFEREFGALGVVYDFADMAAGELLVKNSPGRIAELSGKIGEVLAAGTLSRVEARALRGRLHHARGQTFGRCGAAAFRALGAVADGQASREGFGEALGALAWFRDFLERVVPRTVRGVMGKPAVLFVDGCCEPESEMPFVGIGAVLFSPRRLGPVYFGVRLGPSILKRWGTGDKKQLVGHAELLPVPVAKSTWRDLIRGLGLLVFLWTTTLRATASCRATVRLWPRRSSSVQRFWRMRNCRCTPGTREFHPRRTWPTDRRAPVSARSGVGRVRRGLSPSRPPGVGLTWFATWRAACWGSSGGGGGSGRPSRLFRRRRFPHSRATVCAWRGADPASRLHFWKTAYTTLALNSVASCEKSGLVYVSTSSRLRDRALHRQVHRERCSAHYERDFSRCHFGIRVWAGGAPTLRPTWERLFASHQRGSPLGGRWRDLSSVLLPR